MAKYKQECIFGIRAVIEAVVPVLAAFTVSSVTCNSERIRGPHVGL